MGPASDPPSRSSTPRAFTNQSASAEELLKSQTVGLVNLSDFRKRRAEVLEQKEREAQDKTYSRFKPSISGNATPARSDSGDGEPSSKNGLTYEPPRKKKKKAAKGLLSFGHDDEEDDEAASVPSFNTPKSSTLTTTTAEVSAPENSSISRKLAPNPNSPRPAPKVLTKAARQAEASTRDQLRREFLALQETVRATEVLIPFVFYDGTNIPGGHVKIKKGDHIWFFLDRCRKVGAELGVSGGGAGGSSGNNKTKSDTRKAWARVGVDDLLCVRGEVIIPHHYELYYFIANRVMNPSKHGLLFDYSNTAPQVSAPEDEVEGNDHDPTLTKVVERRWYERNKHIFPASLWKEYEPGSEFEEKMARRRRDGQGNAFFF